MVELFRQDAVANEAWTICRWHDCPDEVHALPTLPFHDTGGAAQWLRGCRADGLRRLAFDVLDSAAQHRMTDEQLVQQLAVMIVNGELRVIRGSLNQYIRRVQGQEPTVEEKILRRLRVTSHTFPFEGDRFRIVSAPEWAQLQGSDDERFQVVPSDQARALMTRLAASSTLSLDESQAVAEAVPLLPEVWRPAQARSGILLIRIVHQIWQLASESSADVATPSQLAGRQPEQDHWIQITLLDDTDQPVPNQAYKVELPGGEIREGRLDAQGLAYIGGLKVGGSCKVCFPQIDAKEWRAA